MTWNKNDREESKPSWLNPAQKINCVRTVKGWEIPLHGTSLGANFYGMHSGTGMTWTLPHMELIVAMPIDAGQTGGQSLTAGTSVTAGTQFYANRFSMTGGATSSGDAPNFAPYITCPFNGDSATAGGWDSTGLSFAPSTTAGFTGGAGATSFGYYGVNGYGVSTLNYPGATAYVKIVANDVNFTQNLTFTLPANTAQTPNTMRASLFQGASLVNGTIPNGVYEAFFGPTASVNNNIAVLQIPKAGATANQNYKATVLVTDNGVGGLTGISVFTVSFGATA